MRKGFGEWLSSQVQDTLKNASGWLTDANQPEAPEKRHGGRKQAPTFHEPEKPSTPETLEVILRDPDQQRRAIRDLLDRTFGARAPQDMALEPLLAFAVDPQSLGRFNELCTLLAQRGAPCTTELLAGWLGMLNSSRLFGLFERLLTMLDLKSDEDWGLLYALLHANWGRSSFERIFSLADGLAPLNRPLNLLSIDALIKGLPTTQACEYFLQASRFFRANEHMSWDALDAVIMKYAKDMEPAAAVGELGSLLMQRGREDYRAADLEFLFSEINTRTAVKRVQQAFKILDEQQIRFDEFDAFVTSFARTSEDLEWLTDAVNGGKESGRTVTRVSLVQLREWAPTTLSLNRYLRGVWAFHGSGLSTEEIDSLLLPHLESEAKASVMAAIGELGSRLFGGTLTLERTQTLFAQLPERSAVKRYEQAVLMLRETGMRPVDIDVIAPEFSATADDAIWLEAFVRNSTELACEVDRLELVHIRERCPEVPQIYRYFRLRKLLERCPQLSARELQVPVFDAVIDEDHALPDLIETFVEWGRNEECQAADILKLLEAFPGRAGVQRYRTALQNFQGSWSSLDDMAMAFATSEERASIMAMVGRSLSAKDLNDIDRNPVLIQTLRSVIAKADQGADKT